MHIAAVTNDGRSISAHFGRARNYLVMTVEDGKVVSSEMRDKAACEHGHHKHEDDSQVQAGSNVSLTAATPTTPAISEADTHNQATALIADCEVVLSRGMGRGMYANLQRAGLRVVLTKITLIDDAVEAFLAGTLEEHPELVH
jgi:predicted Fe-Mo cluster-binding NifX family protein